MRLPEIAAAGATRRGYAWTALAFVALNACGFAWAGGLAFVQGWGGGVAAVIATYYLVLKRQGYWAWMVVNAALWTALFFHDRLPMLAWLQISFVGLCTYGAVQWALVRFEVGFRLDRRSDVVGAVIATLVFACSVVAYIRMPGYSWTLWWWLEFGSVAASIAAIWMDAYRYRLNWALWTASNALSGPLFWHEHAAGPFWTIFACQALNVWGFVAWTRDAQRLADEDALARAA